MSGFQTEMFVRGLAPEFTCPICLLGLRHPVQTPCGHRFCRLCARHVIREYGVYPLDNNELTEHEDHCLVCPFFPGERSVDGQRQTPTTQLELLMFRAVIIVITRMM